MSFANLGEQRREFWWLVFCRRHTVRLARPEHSTARV